MTIHSLTPLTKLVLYSVMYGLWQVLKSEISAWMSASSSLLSSRSICAGQYCGCASRCNSSYVLDSDRLARVAVNGLEHLSKAPACTHVSHCHQLPFVCDLLPSSSMT